MDPLNIDVVGPGAWYIIHMLAMNSKTKEEIEGFHQMVKLISKHFFCMKCRQHFYENYQEFPPPLLNNNHQLFIWTIEMHNKVNSINGKSNVLYSDAIKFYGAGGSNCDGDCGSNKSTHLQVSEKLINVLTSNRKFIHTKKKYDL